MYPYQLNGLSQIVPVAGQRVYSRLINSVQSQFVQLIFRGTLTIAGGNATAIRNRGSILAAFTEVGIDENGTDKHLYDPRLLRFLSEMASFSALSAQRVTSVNAGAYTLEETVRIYFAHPFSVIPRETSYLERDVKQLLQVFATLDNGGGGSKLANVGGAVTAVLSNVSISVQHGYDATEQQRPFFIPIVRQQIATVASANTRQQEFIKTSNPVRAIALMQDTGTDGEVNDIINKLVLKGDFHDIIGPQPVAWNDLVLSQEYDFGGAVVTSNRAMLGLNFQQHGRLTNVLGPSQDNNLRFEFDVQPSVAGAGGSKIRIALIELLRDPALVAEKIPLAI